MIELNYSKGRSVSIVIPVYNAEATIQPLCRRLIELYEGAWRLVIVLVNDCSTDNTDAICRELHRVHLGVIHYLRLAKNFGEHCAVMAGLNHASGEMVVIMDDDFQNPPEEVSTLVEAMATTGHDVVYANYDRKNDPYWRNLGSRFNNWMATKALRKPHDLYLSSFKVLNRFVVAEIVKFKGPDPYLDALVLRTTNSIGTATVRHDPRKLSRSGYTFRKLFGLWASMLIVFSLYPIRLIGAIGICILMLGTYLMVADTYHSIVQPTHSEPTEVEGLTALLVFLRGISLVAVGIIGEYVGRMLNKFSANPQFIVREELPPLRTETDGDDRLRLPNAPAPAASARDSANTSANAAA